MHKGNTKRRINIKRLCLVDAVAGTGGGITYLAQTAVTRQRTHIARAKYIAYQAMRFIHAEELVVGCGNACSVLAPVLQKQQTIVNGLVHWIAADNPYNSAHVFNSRNNYLIRQPGPQRGWKNLLYRLNPLHCKWREAGIAPPRLTRQFGVAAKGHQNQHNNDTATQSEQSTQAVIGRCQTRFLDKSGQGNIHQAHQKQHNDKNRSISYRSTKKIIFKVRG